MINYPYLAPGRTIKYVSLKNRHLQQAKKIAELGTCLKLKTGAVLVKNGKIIGRGSNTGIKKIKVCPRDEMPTGSDYSACKAICGQKGHAEDTAIDDAVKNNKNTKGADVYLWGHWWCCEPCWKKMIGAGIRNVCLLENSFLIFNKNINKNPKNAYIAGGLTYINEQNQKRFYEKIARACQNFKIEAYLPHKHTDPIKHKNIPPRKVYEIDLEKIKNSDLLIADVSEPSLSVGTELEIAKESNVNVILLAETNTKISRMALGNPAVVKTIFYNKQPEALSQLRKIFKVWKNNAKAASRRDGRS